MRAITPRVARQRITVNAGWETHFIVRLDYPDNPEGGPIQMLLTAELVDQLIELLASARKVAGGGEFSYVTKY